MKKNPLIYAHRTGCGLYPENSLYGFKKCVAAGYDVIDMDIHLCKDGHFVLSHDPYLSPLYCSKKKLSHLIKELERSDLESFIDTSTHTANKQPPTFLDQIFSYGRPFETFYQIELKYDVHLDKLYPERSTLVSSLVQILEQFDVVEKVEIQSFDFELLSLIHQKKPSIKTAFLTQSPFEDFSLIVHLGGSIWGPRADLINSNLVKKAHALHLKVVPWTVNLLSEMMALIDLNVDGIITDRPDILKEFLLIKK